MFRFYAYYSKHNDPTAAIALRSEKFNDRSLCQIALDDMLAVPGFTGGGVEQHVPGIGWVLADDAETAVICHNRMLADREHVEQFLDLVGAED